MFVLSMIYDDIKVWGPDECLIKLFQYFLGRKSTKEG